VPRSVERFHVFNRHSNLFLFFSFPFALFNSGRISISHFSLDWNRSFHFSCHHIFNFLCLSDKRNWSPVLYDSNDVIPPLIYNDFKKWRVLVLLVCLSPRNPFFDIENIVFSRFSIFPFASSNFSARNPVTLFSTVARYATCQRQTNHRE
jgi:hypothetical protein